MRISISNLRRIIKEEVARLHETPQDDEPISGRIDPAVLAKYAGKIAADAGYKGSKSAKAAKTGENVIYNNPRIHIEDILGTIEFVESEGEDMFMPHPNYHDELTELGFNVSRGLSLDPPAEVKSAGSWGGVSSKPKPKVKGKRVKVWYPDEELRHLNPIVGTIVHDSFEGVDMLTPEDPEVIDELAEIGYYIDEDGLGLYADPEMVPGIIIKDI